MDDGHGAFAAYEVFIGCTMVISGVVLFGVGGGYFGDGFWIFFGDGLSLSLNCDSSDFYDYTDDAGE